MLLALWLPLIAITGFIASCKKNGNNLPYEVRSYQGGYQFGAAIDGVEFVPNGDLITGISPVKVALSNQINGSEVDWYFGTYFFDQPNNYIRRLHMYIRNFSGIGKYSFNKITNAYPLPRPLTYAGYQDEPWLTGAGLPDEYFMTNTRDTGYINCNKYDASGKEFEFKYTCRSLLNPTKNKTISGVIRY